jgi:hypothetical protein
MKLTLTQLADLMGVETSELLPYIQNGMLRASGGYELSQSDLVGIKLSLVLKSMCERISKVSIDVKNSFGIKCVDCQESIEPVGPNTILWSPICELCAIDRMNLMQYRRESL